MSNVNIKKGKSKRIFYFDALRALAIISVILFHVFQNLSYVVVWDYSTIPSLNWFIADFLGTFFRCGVDLFLMLSGALSLGRVWEIKPFLAKRLPRIIYPFLLWGFVLTLVIFLISIFIPDAVSIFQQYKFGTFSSYDLNGFLQFLMNAYVAKARIWFRPYWFFWMILGTYLIMPIFNRWLLHADLKEAEYFLFFWLITCLFDFTFGFSFPVQLKYFAGAIGMVVLGYYLRHTERKIFNNVYCGIVLTVVPAILMIFVSYLMSKPGEIYYFSRYSIFLAFESMGLFVLFKNFNQLPFNFNFLKNPDGIFRKSVFSIAKYSYGIYLVHHVILNLLMLILISTLHFKAMVVALFIGTLILSWGLLAVLNRVPYLNRYIGAK